MHPERMSIVFMGIYSTRGPMCSISGPHLNSFSLVKYLSHGRACALLNPYYTLFSTQRRMYPGFIDSDEQREAQNAFLEKRKPNFFQFREKDYDEYLKNRRRIRMR